MATTKPTRSPRRAQLHSTPARARGTARKHLVAELPVFESLYALNRDFEQVLADLERLQELSGFQLTDLGLLSVIIQETRAWANLELVKALQPREPEDRAQFGGLLTEAARLLERRKPAGKKKGQQKRRGAGSEGV